MFFVAGAFLGSIWMVIVLKAFIALLRTLRPDFLPMWFAKLQRYAPTWNLFGQGGATFDLYGVISDNHSEREEHFHSDYGNTRRWFHLFLNPYSRHRYLVRELMQSSMYYHLSGIPDRPISVRAVGILEDVVKDEIRRLHPNDYIAREIRLYVVMDRGHYASVAPEAKISFGPFNH